VDLALWANRYKSIREMDEEDRPPVDLIEDDSSLDKYLDNLSKKRQQQRHRAKSAK